MHTRINVVLCASLGYDGTDVSSIAEKKRKMPSDLRDTLTPNVIPNSTSEDGRRENEDSYKAIVVTSTLFLCWIWRVY